MPYRVFISYAHNDDAPPIDGGGEGFVSALMRRVAHYLKTNGPPTPEFFRDIYEIRKSRPFTPIIEEHLRQSDALIIVLSRNWIASEYCRRELDLFRSQRSSENVQRLQQRLILVAKQFMPVESFPQLLRDGAAHPFQEGHTFYREHEERRGLYVEYFAEGEREQPKEFNQAAKELASDLWERAEEQLPQGVQKPFSPIVTSSAAKTRKIFLAKPASDMSEPYARLVEELQGRGYAVAPDPQEKIPSDATAVPFIDDALQNAEVSIHLIGEKVGPAPDEEDHILPLQLRLASERATATTDGNRFRRIIWAPRVVPGNGDAASERDALDVIARFGTVAGDMIEGCELGDFVEIVIKHLGDNAPPVELPQYDDAISADRSVYVFANERDADYAIAVGDVLQRKCKPVPTIFEDDQDERKAWHEKQLATCDEVMIPWADAGAVWVRSNSEQLRNWRDLGRDKPFVRRSVVTGPPSGKDKTSFTRLPPREAIDVVLDLTAYPTVPTDAFDPLFPEKPV